MSVINIFFLEKKYSVLILNFSRDLQNLDLIISVKLMMTVNISIWGTSIQLNKIEKYCSSVKLGKKKKKIYCLGDFYPLFIS